MNQKSTVELSHEIKSARDIDEFLLKNKDYMQTRRLSEHLKTLLAKKELSRADVVRGSLLDRAYVYQIFSGEKTPSRDKLIAIAFGLRLTADETQNMLKLSGNRELYVKDKRDAVILFALHRKKNMLETNVLLNRHSFGALGAPL